jgi:hypothetical protein
MSNLLWLDVGIIQPEKMRRWDLAPLRWVFFADNLMGKGSFVRTNQLWPLKLYQLNIYLLGGLEHDFYVPFHIWDNPNPIDELIFFKMVKTTNQI